MTQSQLAASDSHPPTLLLLNGVSSSGKTSLLEALQDRLPGPWLEAGLDKFLWMLPKPYLNTTLWQDIFTYERGQNGTLQRIRPGPQGNRLVLGMHRAWAALLEAGNDILADHVLLDPAWLLDCAHLLRNQRAFLIGLRCSLEVLEAREQHRQDRTLGQARAQYPYIHTHNVYDFEVDTAQLFSEQAAEAIIVWLESGPEPYALQIIDERNARGGSND
jgi:chloramphenicol 3-O phosphotransferase